MKIIDIDGKFFWNWIEVVVLRRILVKLRNWIEVGVEERGEGRQAGNSTPASLFTSHHHLLLSSPSLSTPPPPPSPSSSSSAPSPCLSLYLKMIWNCKSNSDLRLSTEGQSIKQVKSHLILKIYTEKQWNGQALGTEDVEIINALTNQLFEHLKYKVDLNSK